MDFDIYSNCDQSMSNAAAAAQRPGQCAILPTTPAGHSGSRLGPRRIGLAGKPSFRRAWRAQKRPVENSRRRLSTAARTSAASSGYKKTGGIPPLTTADLIWGESKYSIMFRQSNFVAFSVLVDPETGGYRLADGRRSPSQNRRFAIIDHLP